MELDYENKFDLITLIYCDFGVLSDENRKRLIQKIHKALRRKGRLIFVVFTPKFYLSFGGIVPICKMDGSASKI